jgi:predicted amidophosphoribosyltransferase
MFEARDEFLYTFCETCFQPEKHEGCGYAFQSIVVPISCPEELLDTHYVCQFCLDLFPRTHHHEKKCVFAMQYLKLRAGGWSTPTSNKVLQSIRRQGFSYYNPMINLIRILLSEINIDDAILVPIPMGSTRQKDLWFEMVREASPTTKNIEFVPIVSRKKQFSTRKSLAQVRKRIVQSEYQIDEKSASIIKDRPVVLFDDNVTTGTTMAAIASLLQQFNPGEIIPVAIERHVSARVLQRCPQSLLITCPHYSRKNESA